MNLKLFIGTLMVLHLVMNSSIIHAQKEATLVDVLNSIVWDPRFLTLSDYEKLEILITIHNILNESYKERSQKHAERKLHTKKID